MHPTDSQPAPADAETPPQDAAAQDVVAAPEAEAPAAETPLAATPSTAGPAAAPPTELSPAACAQELKQRWPALFTGAPKPVKLRIHVDIQQRAPGVFTRAALSAFFRRYTGSTSYLLAVANGKQRFDLDGQPSGEVTDENRKVAADELQRRRANQASRRELEEQQRRNRAGLLHDYGRTTLTRANFCALKGVAEEELDGLLAIAAEEAREVRAPEQRGPRRSPVERERGGSGEGRRR